ncbi:MAG TPA: hypothetical protein VK604_06645 [Bryobacteraceae bacterium]|nr:hypothetical protein [Bryobacteraceae bacterium]
MTTPIGVFSGKIADLNSIADGNPDLTKVARYGIFNSAEARDGDSDLPITGFKTIRRTLVFPSGINLMHIDPAKENVCENSGSVRFESMSADDRPVALTVDAEIALKVGRLVHPLHAETLRARLLQSRDFKTDDNFVVLGSPASNPWVALFADKLD